jgi:hypothetical protein
MHRASNWRVSSLYICSEERHPHVHVCISRLIEQLWETRGRSNLTTQTRSPVLCESALFLPVGTTDILLFTLNDPNQSAASQDCTTTAETRRALSSSRLGRFFCTPENLEGESCTARVTCFCVIIQEQCVFVWQQIGENKLTLARKSHCSDAHAMVN